MKKQIQLMVGLTFTLSLSGLFLQSVKAETATEQETSTQFELKGMILPSGSGGEEGPDGGTTVPVDLDSQFGFLFKPKKFDFGTIASLELGQPIKNQKVINGNGAVGIGDTRGTHAGWTLTAQATPLEATALNGNKVNLIGTITMDAAVKSVSYNPQSSPSYQLEAVKDEPQQPSLVGSTLSLLMGGAETAIMTADAGKGEGMWGAELSNISLSAQGSQTGSLVAGDYGGTIVWKLNATPSQN
ncbi:WxL domain-containing protein [Enterococcus hirae]|nr:WxL domain-containing protein [Enterococcus hirae]